MKSQITRNKYNNSAERTPTPISPRFHPESGEETRNPNNKPFIRFRLSNHDEETEELNNHVMENSSGFDPEINRPIDIPKIDETFQKTSIELGGTSDVFHFNRAPSDHESIPDEEVSKIEVFQDHLHNDRELNNEFEEVEEE